MNQHLETVLNFIQQSNGLSDDAKNDLLKAVQKVDGELEHKNSELEIETSLERIRTVAMSMNKPADLLNICEVLFAEILVLGFDELRNTVININDDETGSFLNYDYSPFAGANVTTVFYNSHPAVEYLVKKIKSSNDAFAEFVIKGNELNEWREYLKGLGKKEDPRLQNLPELPYYFYSIGAGEIGISTYSSITEEKRKLLRRFRNVFDFAYRRYTDIALAEAQTRQAQIELALERVRARTMAMQRSDELSEVAYILFQQFQELGESPIQITIGIINEEEDLIEFRVTSWTGGGSKINDAFNVSINEPTLISKIYKAWKEQKKSLVVDLSGKELDDWINYRNTISGVKVRSEDTMGRRVISNAYFSKGHITFSTLEPRPQESIRLLERFAGVFDLTYTRFLDLKLAEAHAEKAQIEEGKLREEKKRSDSLLLNILPEEVANELKQFGKSYARKHEEVTILFSDIKGFSSIAENLSADELVTQLDECFRAFDKIIEKHGLEKIKTVGDAYICACGLPKPVHDNATKTVGAAIDMLDFLKGFNISKKIQNLPAFEFRIGIHTGPVVTGVVGLKKFTYDIWGDAVNMAARMEQHGEAGKINVSGNTYRLIKEKFTCVPRGKIQAKNKGEVDMYFVDCIK